MNSFLSQAAADGDQAAAEGHVLSRFVANLATGGRLLFLLPVHRGRLFADATQLLLLLSLTVLLKVALEFVPLASSAPEFSRWALGPLALLIGVEFVAVYLVALATRRLDALMPLLVALSALGPPSIVLTQPMTWTGSAELLGTTGLTVAGGAVAALGVIAILRALRLVLGAAVLRAGLLAAFYVAINWGGAGLFPPVGLWYVPRDESEAPKVDVEALYYAQPQRLAAATAGLLPQRPGVVDLYLVGFGGWANQDVFLREVTAVQKLFDERFDSAGRSLVLLNNPATVDKLPLANAHNLHEALQAVASRMDVEEDVLFLFLTSHGSEDHSLSVSFWPLGLNDLTPTQLRGLLDDSGIRNRVVVVSACYSGGFVEDLRDERTLVITAAAADRQSFGCGHHNDFTWFGKAYFDEALREQYDFVAAFSLAAQRVAERETAEAETPSRPQMAEGAAIGPVLKALEARLRQRAAKAQPAAVGS